MNSETKQVDPKNWEHVLHDCDQIITFWNGHNRSASTVRASKATLEGLFEKEHFMFFLNKGVEIEVDDSVPYGHVGLVSRG